MKAPTRPRCPAPPPQRLPRRRRPRRTA
jgi:hypothetical protein